MERTLDQIRVAVALREKGNVKSGEKEGKKVKNFPSMVQINGLLGAFSYASERKIEKGNDKGPQNRAEHSIAKIIIKYLNELEKEYSCLGVRIGSSSDGDSNDIIEFINHLAKCTPEQFRRINAEVIAFLNYLRRFAS